MLSMIDSCLGTINLVQVTIIQFSVSAAGLHAKEWHSTLPLQAQAVPFVQIA